MKFLKISQAELIRIRELYEAVMSHACHGLFFREGAVLGTEVSTIAMQDRLTFFETAERLLKARGWADSIKFKETEVEVLGSIEVSKSKSPTCHRIRGMLRLMYENYYKQNYHCIEEECESTGKDRCLFKLQVIGQ